jgi:hypothetical protein
MKVSRKSVVAIASLACAGALASAGAQASFSQCNANRSCLWGNNDFVFLIGERPPGGGLVNLTGDANNEMDSWGNRTTTNSSGYGSAGGSGDCQTFGAGQRDNNVAFFNSDEVSSWRTNAGC